jgi:hypothetical protein
MKRDWKRSRFDDTMEDPQTSLVNLVDIMLVFICGLVVALVSAQRQTQAAQSAQAQAQVQHSAAAGVKQVVEKGRELPEMPAGLRGQTAGEGMQPVGQVFRDPKTGKLILVGQ